MMAEMPGTVSSDSDWLTVLVLLQQLVDEMSNTIVVMLVDTVSFGPGCLLLQPLQLSHDYINRSFKKVLRVPICLKGISQLRFAFDKKSALLPFFTTNGVEAS
jgi:hypothetical protein